MSDAYTIGEAVVIQDSENDDVPERPGVVVGYIVRIPGCPETFAAFKGELRSARPDEVESAKIHEACGELVETAEEAFVASIKAPVTEAVEVAVRDASRGTL